MANRNINKELFKNFQTMSSSSSSTQPSPSNSSTPPPIQPQFIPHPPSQNQYTPIDPHFYMGSQPYANVSQPQPYFFPNRPPTQLGGHLHTQVNQSNVPPHVGNMGHNEMMAYHAFLSQPTQNQLVLYDQSQAQPQE